MEDSKSTWPRVEIITPEQRIAEDPRGLERVTIVGDLIFRRVKTQDPEREGNLREMEESNG